MIIRISGHAFHYEMENLCRVFFPDEKITLDYVGVGEDSRIVSTEIIPLVGGAEIKVTCNIDGAKIEMSQKVLADEHNLSDECELIMAQLLFRQMCKITGYTPEWGVLTGVRPSKLMTRLIKDYGEEGALQYFTEKLLVSNSKTGLALSVSRTEQKIIELSTPKSFSLYVSIPFCPSRCSYCSFVSHSITSPNAAKLLPAYLENLHEEIRITGKIASSLGLRLESVYFGGGTPSVLEAPELESLLIEIERSFDMSTVREYTVECGRPDTITKDKLAALLRHNVGRISINPQTFNQRVLDSIGRCHTEKQAIDAYHLARNLGFKIINMDLIAGLPDESIGSFCESVNIASSLVPANITVHTLALKRSSNLAAGQADFSGGAAVAEMLEYSVHQLHKKGYKPYYMYRQSRCIGNMENVGWCLDGAECLYNIFMMEECHTVLAVGAGSVTKLRAPNGDYIERIFNYKYPYEYNSGFNNLIERKERIKEFYSLY